MKLRNIIHLLCDSTPLPFSARELHRLEDVYLQSLASYNSAVKMLKAIKELRRTPDIKNANELVRVSKLNASSAFIRRAQQVVDALKNRQDFSSVVKATDAFLSEYTDLTRKAKKEYEEAKKKYENYKANSRS